MISDNSHPWLTADLEQLQIKYQLLLDSATGLREHMKDIYNSSCFRPDIAPPGMLEDFRLAVHDTAHKALVESVSVSRIQYAADLADYEESKSGGAKETDGNA